MLSNLPIKSNSNFPSIEEVKFSTFAELCELPIVGHFITGDKEKDKELENEIKAKVAKGNIWAWCNVEVTATWEGFSATEYLGAACYDSLEDFQSDSEYTSMKTATYQVLMRELDNFFK